MKRHNDQKLGDVLKQWVNQPKIKAKLNQTRVKSLWKEMMGTSINRYTTELYVRRKKLYVTLESAPLKQELSMGKEKIINMINEALGEEYIKEVIFL